MIKNKIRTAAVAMIAVIALAGCTTEPPEDEPTTSPGTTQTDGPTTEPTVAAPVVGGTVTAEDAETLPEGFHAYTMADGTLVVTQEGQPLPAAVIADIAAPVAAVTASLGGVQDPATQAGHLAQDQASKVYRETGMWAIVVYKSYGACFDDQDNFYSCAFYQLPPPYVLDPAPRDLATALAGAEAYVAGQDDPTRWVIINATGE